MPQINKREIKEKPIKYKHEKKEKTTDFYGSLAWKRLRDTYISLHPICECCLEHHKVTSATAVHHKCPWSRGESEEEQWKLFLDEKNLMSVCEQCHIGLHNKDREYHLGILDSLTDIEYNYIHHLNH